MHRASVWNAHLLWLTVDGLPFGLLAGLAWFKLCGYGSALVPLCRFWCQHCSGMLIQHITDVQNIANVEKATDAGNITNDALDAQFSDTCALNAGMSA